MGQYYHALIGDEMGENTRVYTQSVLTAEGEVEYQGSKLMEHSYMDNRFMMGIAALLLNSPKRLIWVGDYADARGWSDCEGVTYLVDKEGRNPNVTLPTYEEAWPYNDYDEKPVADAPDFDWTGLKLLNHDKQMYVDLDTYIKYNTVKSGKWLICISPLSLLTEVGNGQGGGDYLGTDMYELGTWAWDLLELSATVPDGYEELSPVFKER